MTAPRILVLDNRDSFTFNVVQALRLAGAATGVVDSRSLDPERIAPLRLDGLVVSPGPGRPEHAGASEQIMQRLAPRIPVWGICLGHQCLAHLHDATIVPSKRIHHGKTSVLRHLDTGLFAGLPEDLEVMRYNSLVVDPDSLPDRLRVTAWTDEGEVMAICDRETGAEGVQFHPESVLSTASGAMFANFVQRCATRRESLQGIA
jgi:anthranilate synthase component 2